MIAPVVQRQREEGGWEKRKNQRAGSEVREGGKGLPARRKRLDLEKLLLATASEEEGGAADEAAQIWKFLL